MKRQVYSDTRGEGAKFDRRIIFAGSRMTPRTSEQNCTAPPASYITEYKGKISTFCIASLILFEVSYVIIYINCLKVYKMEILCFRKTWLLFLSLVSCV